jgi:hypothetical protein
MQSYFQLITPASTYCVSLTDLKDHLTYSDDNSDARLTSYLISATAYCEAVTNIAIMPQTWQLNLPCFPYHFQSIPAIFPAWFGQYSGDLNHFFRHNKIMLDKPPVTSVVNISYYDTTNTLQTWGSDQYYVQLPHNKPAFIEPVTFYPPTYGYYRSDAVQIQFNCGSSTPNPLFCHAVKLMCGGWDQYRESEEDNNTKEIEFGVSKILNLMNAGLYI